MSKAARIVGLTFIIGLVFSGLTWFAHDAATEPLCGGLSAANCDVTHYGRGWPVQYTHDITVTTPESVITAFLLNSFVWFAVTGMVIFTVRKIMEYLKR